jgi:hypothetical protein
MLRDASTCTLDTATPPACSAVSTPAELLRRSAAAGVVPATATRTSSAPPCIRRRPELADDAGDWH